ncbi:protein FAM167B [Varanus komodoensis]|uniref:Family with sequence similarity 167 member B n=1 Tax=Varanus komodoensis TaxID=61221 RepID=A0A8D2KXP2_VARKO|nr:protein FAM167B [Varanus komodoensis]
MALVKFQELGEDESGVEDCLDSIKALAAKLKLQTRRPSYLEWRAHVQSPSWRNRLLGGPLQALQETRAEEVGAGDSQPRAPSRTICGFPTISHAFEWLRTELREMQAMDHRLARQLMALRAQIHRLKVEQACHQHKEMLDDATFKLEGCEEDSDLLCNIPPKMAFLLSTPLKHIGVTRMNINSRRFSLC